VVGEIGVGVGEVELPASLTPARAEHRRTGVELRASIVYAPRHVKIHC
jgi:hypothetical protein